MTASSLAESLEGACAAFEGTAGIAAHNLTTDETVAINQEERFPTASMIKILILFELVRQCARGQAQMWERVSMRREDRTLGSGLMVDLDEGAAFTLRDLAVLMMAISDNTATNMLIDRLGMHAINTACREASMYSTELRGRVDFDRIRESPENLAVGTPRDFCAFFTALHRGELLHQAGVEQLLGIMRIQKYGGNIGRHLPYNPYAHEFGRPQEIWIAAKTGGLEGIRTEAALIHTARADWSLCVMTKDCPDRTAGVENAAARFIGEASRLVYDAWGAE